MKYWNRTIYYCLNFNVRAGYPPGVPRIEWYYTQDYAREDCVVIPIAEFRNYDQLSRHKIIDPFTIEYHFRNKVKVIKIEDPETVAKITRILLTNERT